MDEELIGIFDKAYKAEYPAVPTYPFQSPKTSIQFGNRTTHHLQPPAPGSILLK